MLPVKSALTLAYALSGVLAVLLLASSVIGLFYGGRGLYESYPASLAGLVGQDAFTLAVGLPLLVVSAWHTSRGSTRGLLVWAGTLFYFAYSYFFYVIGGFNALFLVYVAVVSASLYGLLSVLFAVDPAALRGRIGAGAPARLVACFLIGIASLFALMWGGMIVSSVVSGTRPEEVLREVVIIDGAVLLPLLFFGGVRLWRSESWGYVLGGLLLTKALATGSTLAFTTALGAWWAGAITTFDAFLFVVFALMAVVAMLLIVPYLRSPEKGGGRRTDLR